MSLNQIIHKIIGRERPIEESFEHEKEEAIQYLQSRAKMYESLIHKIKNEKQPTFEELAHKIDEVQTKDPEYNDGSSIMSTLIEKTPTPVALMCSENFNYDFHKDLRALVTLYKEPIKEAVKISKDFLEEKTPSFEEPDKKEQYHKIYQNNSWFWEDVDSVNNAMQFKSNKEFDGRDYIIRNAISRILYAADSIIKYHEMYE